MHGSHSLTKLLFKFILIFLKLKRKIIQNKFAIISLFNANKCCIISRCLYNLYKHINNYTYKDTEIMLVFKYMFYIFLKLENDSICKDI